VLDQLVRPIVRGVHSADPDDLALDQVAPGLRSALFRTGSLARAVLEVRATSARAGSAVAGIRGGIFRMVDSLQSELTRFGVHVRLGTAASDVGPESIRIGDETLWGRVVVVAPGIVGTANLPGTSIILATLVVDQPLLDAEPRGTGLLVAEGAAGIRARALTHSTAKWKWLAEQAGGRHVLRLSYDATAENLALTEAQLRDIARQDAATLLGVPLAQASVHGFARVEWYRPPRVTTTPADIPLGGESIAGTGLASVVARSEALAAQLLADAEG
jgi:oxygen-dependent protoporphyrinogen oxidase